MRRMLFPALLIALGASAFAQGGNTITRVFSGVPTGSCSNVQVGLNLLNGDYYDCLAGAWNKVGPGGGGGSGTVTSVSDLSPLFTTSNPTTTPTFVLSNAAAHSFLMNNTAGSAPPGYQSPGKADLPASAVYNDQSNTYSAGTAQDFDTARAAYWGKAPIIDVAEVGTGADMCDKINSVYSLAAYTGATKAILDLKGFTGTQNCATTDFFSNATIATKWVFGDVVLSMTRYLCFCNPASGNIIAAPSAPALSTSTTGGSLAATTTFGVKINYSNPNMEVGEGTLPSTETTKTTGAGATNSITVTAPTGVTDVTCYNVFSATPAGSGWKLNNTNGCIPIGTNYVIKTVGVGAVPPANGGLFTGQYEIEGQGDSTIFSLDGTNAAIFFKTATPVYAHNFKVSSSQTSTIISNSSINLAESNNDATHSMNYELDHITIQGGGYGILVSPGSGNADNVKITNIRYGSPTFAVGNLSGVFVFGPSNNVLIENIDIGPGAWPSGGTGCAGVYAFRASGLTIKGVRGNGIDMSNCTNGALVTVDGASAQPSKRFNVSDVLLDNSINMDGIAVIGLSQNGNVSNVACTNTNTITGVGANQNNGDCLDLQNVGNISVVNVVGQNIGLSSNSVRFPVFEIYDSVNINLENVAAYDSNGEGMKIFGSPGVTITNPHMARNWSAGITLQDGNTTVNCNTTTTVAYASGNGFGPWVPGTTITIGATAFVLASTPTSATGTLTLTTACSLGAGQAMRVDTLDASIVNPKIDDNGQNGTGNGARSVSTDGIDFTGHSVGTVIGGSINDNAPVLANKHQQYAIRAENSARFRAIGVDGSGNGGGTACGLEIAPPGAATKWFCDSVKTSVVSLMDDGTTNKAYMGTPLILPAATTLIPSLNMPSGTAPTSPTTGDHWYDGTNFKLRNGTTTVSIGQVIASGTTTLTSGTITTASCQAANTTAATGTATTDTISWAYNAAPSGTTDARLTLAPYVTANNVNFVRCNPTAASISATAIVVNWRVVR